MKDYELVRLSKRMSYALRHHPDEFGLELSSDGSVEIGRLIEGINMATSSEYTLDSVIAVLRMPGKKRFFLKDGMIAAYYGHTAEREVVRMEIAPPSVLYHATSHKAIGCIRKEGLLPMSRQHVHLSAAKETALVAGRRRDGHPVLLKVDAKRAYEDGVRFYQGNEDIYLADPIGAGYLTEVEY